MQPNLSRDADLYCKSVVSVSVSVTLTGEDNKWIFFVFFVEILQKTSILQLLVLLVLPDIIQDIDRKKHAGLCCN